MSVHSQQPSIHGPWLKSITMLVLALAIGAAPFTVRAQGLSPEEIEEGVLLLTEEYEVKGANAVVDDQEKFEVVYDPNRIEVQPDQGFDRARVLRELEAEAGSYRIVTVTKKNKTKEVLEGPVNDRVFIPEAPSDVAQLEKIEHLGDHDLEMFLAKKRTFLKRFAWVLEKVRVKPKLINKLLLEINQKFYNSSTLIAKSNAMGATVMFSLSGGIALPAKLVEKLSGTRIGKFIPKSGGFYYLLGIGAGITRHVVDGRSNLLIELFVDRESLKSTLTGLVELSGAGTYGVVYEHRDGDFKSQENETTYGGLAGVFRKGENQFGWSASTGVSFPPMIGSILVYTDVARRNYLVRLNLTKGYDIVTKATDAMWSLMKAPRRAVRAARCEALFGL